MAHWDSFQKNLVEDMGERLMKVWIAMWDVHNAGCGVEVYASRALAMDAVVGYANEVSPRMGDRPTEAARREQLAETGSLEFEAEECYFGIEEHDVRTAPR